MDFVIIDGKRYTLEDMRDWFIQIRGFPSILVFGSGKNKMAGEGQSGGREISNFVHRVENAFVEKLGADEYQRKLDILMKSPSKHMSSTILTKKDINRMGMLDVNKETKVWD